MKSVKIVLIFLILFISFTVKCDVKDLTSEQLMEAQKIGTIVIDIRTPMEWQETGTIKGAEKIMFFDQQRKPRVSEFMVEFEKLVTTKDQSFILVCHSGTRTKAVTNYLDQKLGYSKAGHLVNGMSQWVAQRHEVEK